MTRKKPSHKAGSARSHFIYGKHAVLAALGNPERQVQQIFATRNMASEVEQANKSAVSVEVVEPAILERVVPEGAVHQGVAVEVTPLEGADLDDTTQSKVVLVLDQVTDPQNVGAILRSAAAFGAGGVVMQDKHSPPETGALAKAASGALEVVPMVRVTNISQALDELKAVDFWCIGLDGQAKEDIQIAQQYDKVALVMGAEGKGLRPLTVDHCDLLVKIPISEAVESLNVSTAAAVALYAIKA